jgi:hypothetical protein
MLIPSSLPGDELLELFLEFDVKTVGVGREDELRAQVAQVQGVRVRTFLKEPGYSDTAKSSV